MIFPKESDFQIIIPVMSETKLKRTFKEPSTTVLVTSTNVSNKIDPDNEVANNSSSSTQAKRNGLSDLVHSTPYKRVPKLEDTTSKKVFAELSNKTVEKKSENESSSSSSINKSDTSKKREESKASSEILTKPKHHFRRAENKNPDNGGRNKDKENLLSLLSNSNSLPQQLFKIQATVPQTTAIVVDPGNDTVPSNIPLDKEAIDAAKSEKETNKYEHQSIDATSNEQAVSLSEDSFPMATTIMMSLLPRKRKWPSSLKSLFCINSIVESNKIEYEESGVCDLQKLPEISTQYRLKEINGFGVLSTTQSLTPANQQIYQKLVATGLELSLEFCRYLEILNERSMKQDIKDSFLIQFGRIHSGLPFTTNHTNSDATKEELLHIGELFDEVFNNNNTVWIANKFEYNSFGRKFRKAIVETLESDYQIRISHRRDLFPRQMIAASLFQWKKNIHLPE